MAVFYLRNTHLSVGELQGFEESLRLLNCGASVSATHLRFVNGHVDLQDWFVDYDEARGSEASIEFTANEHGLCRRDETAAFFEKRIAEATARLRESKAKLIRERLRATALLYFESLRH